MKSTKSECAKPSAQHDASTKRLRNIWAKMKSRCNGTADAYTNSLYYEKGIRYCTEWENFKNFKEWALNNGYADNLTLDRIDNSLGYSPKNCRWATFSEQNRNRTNDKMVTYKGETAALAEFCERYNRSYFCVWSRLKDLGWTVERAIDTPTPAPFNGTHRWKKPIKIYV